MYDAWGNDKVCEACKAKLGDKEDVRAKRVFKWYKSGSSIDTIAYLWGLQVEYLRGILLRHYPFLKGEV